MAAYGPSDDSLWLISTNIRSRVDGTHVLDSISSFLEEVEEGRGGGTGRERRINEN